MRGDAWIRAELQAEEARLLARWPLLRHSDALATGVLALTLLGMAATVLGYHTAALPASVAVVAMAFWFSTLHELEHDLFHGTYWGKAGSQGSELGMWVVYLLKMHASPWWRRPFHLKHHAVSGQRGDVEERLLGLGLPLGLPRLALTLSPLAYVLVAFEVARDSPEFLWYDPLLQSKPAMLVAGFSALAVLDGAGLVALDEATRAWAQTSFVCFFLGSHLRHLCLSLVTTSCHYYGDLARGVVAEQVQVLEPRWLAPVQALCWWFGSTHWVHHFCVKQPFWVRTLVAFRVNARVRSDAWREATSGALRCNDLRSLRFANRRGA